MHLNYIFKKGSNHRKTAFNSVLRKFFNSHHFFGINFVEILENMFIKIATFTSHLNLNSQFLRLNKTYPKRFRLNLTCNLTSTQGASPPKPPYLILPNPND